MNLVKIGYIMKFKYFLFMEIMKNLFKQFDKIIKKQQNDFSIDDTQIQIPSGIKAGEKFSIYTILRFAKFML